MQGETEGSKVMWTGGTHVTKCDCSELQHSKDQWCVDTIFILTNISSVLSQN